MSSEKDFEQSKMEELQSLRESLEQMKEEKKAAEVLARRISKISSKKEN